MIDIIIAILLQVLTLTGISSTEKAEAQAALEKAEAAKEEAIKETIIANGGVGDWKEGPK